jgi:hypothetical protein
VPSAIFGNKDMKMPTRISKPQFHLSTALLLMLGASAMLWINVKLIRAGNDQAVRGWPFTYWKRSLPLGLDPETGFYRRVSTFRSGLSGAPPGFQRFNAAGVTLDLPETQNEFIFNYCCFNLLIAATVLAVLAFVAELMTRKRVVLQPAAR